ncbi:MAG: TIGR00341 family protein, partial [Streptomyces sp.]|nr:TIGR00341 family protein [Streptomyces sp.]
CLGGGAPVLALGALVLFLSNMLSLVFAGTFVFAALGYTGLPSTGRSRRRALLALGGLGVVVAAVLIGSTVVHYRVAAWQSQVKRVTAEWLAADPGAHVIDVRREATTFRIAVRTPAGLPPVTGLRDRLRGVLPDWLPVEVETTQGRRITVTAGS